MGLSNSLSIWQRKVEQILSGIEGVSIFIDNSGVTEKTDEIP